MKRLTLVLILLWPMAALGQISYFTGNELMELCDGTASDEPKENMVALTACLGVLLGISEAISAIKIFTDEGHEQYSCMPNGVTSNQLRQVFLKYMHQHPEDWHATAGGLVMAAYRASWPCKE